VYVHPGATLRKRELGRDIVRDAKWHKEYPCGGWVCVDVKVGVWGQWMA